MSALRNLRQIEKIMGWYERYHRPIPEQVRRSHAYWLAQYMGN